MTGQRRGRGCAASSAQEAEPLADYDRVKALFLQAREMSRGERPAWLEDACGGNTALRGEVESLLAAEAEIPGDYLERLSGLGVSPDSIISRYRTLGGPGTGDVGLSGLRASKLRPLDDARFAPGHIPSISGSEAESGRTLGHYRQLESIGTGGMSVVYRAWDERLERDLQSKCYRTAASPKKRHTGASVNKRWRFHG